MDWTQMEENDSLQSSLASVTSSKAQKTSLIVCCRWTWVCILSQISINAIITANNKMRGRTPVTNKQWVSLSQRRTASVKLLDFLCCFIFNGEFFVCRRDTVANWIQVGLQSAGEHTLFISYSVCVCVCLNNPVWQGKKGLSPKRKKKLKCAE